MPSAPLFRRAGLRPKKALASLERPSSVNLGFRLRWPLTWGPPQLGLGCSSNPVEKENDVVVAHRQKKNGMAWSDEKSPAPSALAAVRRNGTDNWLRDGRLAFRLPRAA